MKYIDFKDRTSIGLLFANVAVIAMTLFSDIELSTLLWIYLIQSIIIGFFFVIKLLSMGEVTSIAMSIFFSIHYGIFHLVYAIFLLTFIFGGSDIFPNFGESQSESESSALGLILIGSLGFFIAHLISYLKNPKLLIDGGTSFSVSNLQKIAKEPYARIMPIHMTIILSFFLPGSKISIILFELLKTGADLVAHNKKLKNSKL